MGLRCAAKRSCHKADLTQEVYWRSGESKRPSQNRDMRKRDRDRETEIDRERDRYTERQTEIERDADRQTDRQRKQKTGRMNETEAVISGGMGTF